MKDNTIIKNQIILAKENNQNAFSFLLSRYWDDVYNFQLKRTNNESYAEDITIESFAKAFEKIKTYNDKFVFKTWVITISKNLHIDQLRKNKIKLNFNESDEFKNSIASMVPIGESILLKTFIFCKSSLSKINSSLLVPDLVISIAG